MLKTHFKTAVRHLAKNRVYTLINVLGLALGMTAALFILQHVYFELSYDTFHKQAEDIYRVPFDWHATDENGVHTEVYASNVPGFGPTAQAEIPEVVATTRLFHVLTSVSSNVLSYEPVNGERISFHEENGFYADSTFFDVFTFPLRYGNVETALTKPQSILLTTSLAEKYFGQSWERDTPIGEIIEINGMQQGRFTVTGILKDVPTNSHIQFDFLLSYSSFRSDAGVNRSWAWSQCYTYLRLTPQANPSVVEEKIRDIINNHYDWEKKPIMFLQHLTSIHLDSDLLFEAGVNGSRTSVYFLSVIGVFILIIGWINYLNQTIAKSFDRAEEVGVKKAIGALKRHILGQFMIESAIINTISVLLAILLVAILQSSLISYLGWNLSAIEMKGLFASDVFIWFILLFLIGSLLSALYPARVMIKTPTIGLKVTKKVFSKGGSLSRQGLVVFQFIASLILIFGSLIVYRQLVFMQQHDLGMDINQVMVLKTSPQSDSTYQLSLQYFKDQVKALANVEEVSATNFVPGKEIAHNRGLSRTDGGTKRGSNFYMVRTDEDFLETLQLNLVAGRNFSPGYTASSVERVVVNEATIDMLGYDSLEAALNQRVTVLGERNTTLEIIGIVKNYNQQLLQKSPESIVLRYAPSAAGYVALRFQPIGNVQQTVEQVQATWRQAFPDQPFDHFFLNEFFNQQYVSYQQFNKVFGLFTALAIFIAGLGLFGLATYTVVRRTKEIGIRKVLGASVSSILVLLSQEYIKLTLIAFVIAMPLANYLFSEWLNGFAYRIGIPWWLFVGTGLAMLIIALLATSTQTVKAARQNPVDSLRDE
ncbi:ABC transporter permease [Tunicatimonas pelagia]|uniref:ABC transporter permease n=1 Tax=Tunicatimonas pelagia TaxID=931531 RepID=UPI002665E094|nr:ABC transporter permease [Tunicatimonas pelagia]WKN43464.1 ABC transporter permease [Tunicatimonas pelagia]